MNSTTTIKDMSATLTPEQVEAFWPLVSSRSIVSELYANSAIHNIWDDVTPDDIRDLAKAIIKEFDDDDGESVSRLGEAMTSRTHTVQALIRFRVGRYAEFAFIKRHLPMHKMQQLAWGVISSQLQNLNLNK